jgi:nitrite reductase/ring-hydroxylating ferredoxin subunit
MVDVGDATLFPEGKLCIINVGNHEVGILRWDGASYAIRNYCPHQGGPVCGWVTSGLTASTSAALEVDRSPVLRCGWHGWEFDVKTGRALWSDRYRLKMWPAHVVDGRVLVEIGGEIDETMSL